MSNLAQNHSMHYAAREGTVIMPAHLSRITTNPEICGGRPCIANTRVRVSDVLDLLAAGESRAAILADYPYLADEDITAALEYASAAAAHRVIAAE
jgi:uncharacterized protein (DUF433 family)